MNVRKRWRDRERERERKLGSEPNAVHARVR